MKRSVVIAGDRHLETLGNCGGYYACPKGSDGRRLGPLVGYAGKYATSDGKQLQFVGDVYANFAMAEMYANVLNYFQLLLAGKLDGVVGIQNVDAFVGAPIGGYSLTDALGLAHDIEMIKAEKKVTALATSTSREKSELVFGRHSVEAGQRVVIVEDVCNNFSTTGQLIDLICSCGGEVLAIACFLNRSLTVGSTYRPGSFTRDIPVVSLVRLPINEWKQDDPVVSDDIASGNVVWKPKGKVEWARLMQAMGEHGR